MGTRLIIRGANFIDYVDKEPQYSEKTISDFEFISSIGSAIGGMDTANASWFGVLSDISKQYGLMVPIDIEGISWAELYNSYGQTAAIHAKVLDVDGNFVMDIMGKSTGIDEKITVSNFPSNSKWLFLNGINTADLSLKIGGYFADTNKSKISHAVKEEQGYIDAAGAIHESSAMAYRNVIGYQVTPGQKILVIGAFAVPGAQDYTLGCFLNSDESLIKTIKLDTTVAPSGNCYGIISATVPDNATILRCNANKNAYPIAYVVAP